MNERDRLLRTTIFDEIDTERKRQDELWGHEFDNKNTPNDWVTFVTRYLSKAADDRAVKREDFEKEYRLNMLKAATIVIAALETYDRQQGTVRRHYE